MADFITAGSEWNGKENEEIILRPAFTSPDVRAMGLRIIVGTKSSVKLNFIDAQNKILKAYAAGWTGGTSTTKRQKKFTLVEFKAENSYSKQDYKDTVLENITNRGGVNQNDISGTDVHNAEVSVFMAGVLSDVFRIFWLGDTTKKTVTSGVSDDSDPDENYNMIQGVWKSIMAVAQTSPTLNQIKRIAIANGTVAQVDTVTLTGTSGTANITINSVNYLATFSTNLTTTASNFVTTHATALLAVGITVTSSTADVIFTATLPGEPHSNPTIANVTGNLAGTNVATTANTPAQDLATDEAITTFESMWKGSNEKLKALKGTGLLRLYCTDTMMENYLETLESLGTEQAHTLTVDGVERTTWRGIPLIPMGIDQYLSADFLTPYPHRAILTAPNNLALVLNGASDIAETRFWFNPDQNENRQRSQFEFAMDYILPEYITTAY